jgi:hypothetical protein
VYSKYATTQYLYRELTLKVLGVFIYSVSLRHPLLFAYHLNQNGWCDGLVLGVTNTGSRYQNKKVSSHSEVYRSCEIEMIIQLCNKNCIVGIAEIWYV